MSYHFEFFTKKMSKPYIPNCITYDLSGSEGCIHFDGYYYIQDSEFPQRFYMEVYHDLSGNQSSKCYYVEFYKRQEVKDTSSYDDDLEEGGRICYFPTMEQKLYFRVLTVFKSINELVDEIKYRTDDDW
jgi:hypothetical protein